eukprot:224529-Rhodomonas_salina.3
MALHASGCDVPVVESEREEEQSASTEIELSAPVRHDHEQPLKTNFGLRVLQSFVPSALWFATTHGGETEE